jgi:carbon-monoxide dehydrogenase medium subunit
MVLRGPEGEREVSAHDFFVDFWETAAHPDEVLVEIRVPALPGRQWGFVKFRQRSQDWATVGVAVQERDDGRRAVALVNMGPTPLRARAVEEALAGGSSVEEAAAQAPEGTTPSSDLRADADYRRHLARVLSARALTQAGLGR